MTFRSSLSTDTQYSRRCSLRRALSAAAGGASETDADGLRYGNAVTRGLSSRETGDAHRRPSAANPAPPAALCLRHRLRHARLSSRPAPRAYCAPYGSTQDPFAPALRPVLATRTVTHLARPVSHALLALDTGAASPPPLCLIIPSPTLTHRRLPRYARPDMATVYGDNRCRRIHRSRGPRLARAIVRILPWLAGEGSLPAVDRSLPPSASATGASPFLGPPRDAPRPFASPEGSFSIAPYAGSNSAPPPAVARATNLDVAGNSWP
ncbi:hypothetical protein DFH06DRAFT_1341841 [Mycena polygramma]|nr:hypothetical protein DFH06DRAFT_1341841 [Mycena polygramma]